MFVRRSDKCLGCLMLMVDVVVMVDVLGVGGHDQEQSSRTFLNHDFQR